MNNTYLRGLACATLAIAVFVSLVTVGPLPLAYARQANDAKVHPGAKFGARDPHVCADSKKPVQGAPSIAQAKEYVTCSNEYVSGTSLYLTSDLKVEIGTGRRYNIKEDLNANNIDVRRLVYPIRGSYKSYQCSEVSEYMGNAGKNCFVYEDLKAQGICYETAFADWVCKMGSSELNLIEKNVAPPK